MIGFITHGEMQKYNETIEDLNNTLTKAKEKKEKIWNLLMQNDERSHEVTSYKERVMPLYLEGCYYRQLK